MSTTLMSLNTQISCISLMRPHATLRSLLPYVFAICVFCFPLSTFAISLDAVRAVLPFLLSTWPFRSFFTPLKFSSVCVSFHLQYVHRYFSHSTFSICIHKPMQALMLCFALMDALPSCGNHVWACHSIDGNKNISHTDASFDVFASFEWPYFIYILIAMLLAHHIRCPFAVSVLTQHFSRNLWMHISWNAHFPKVQKFVHLSIY